VTFKPVYDADGKSVIETGQRGTGMIHDPLLNKGTAFTEKERKDFGLEGLLPSRWANS